MIQNVNLCSRLHGFTQIRVVDYTNLRFSHFLLSLF